MAKSFFKSLNNIEFLKNTLIVNRTELIIVNIVHEIIFTLSKLIAVSYKSISLNNYIFPCNVIILKKSITITFNFLMYNLINKIKFFFLVKLPLGTAWRWGDDKVKKADK